MNKKIGLVVFTILLGIALFNTPLMFAQSQDWDSCEISAYGTNLVEGDPVPEQFGFTVVAPPSGSEITNTIYVLNEDTGENYTKTLSPGDLVNVVYLDTIPSLSINPASEPNHWIISYDGEVSNLTVDGSYIPEFSPILIVPMFMAATILAIVYRRKRTSQTKTTE